MMPEALIDAPLKRLTVDHSQGTQRRTHHRHAPAKGPGVGVDLSDLNIDPALGEHRRGTQAGRAAADDQGILNSRHLSNLLLERAGPRLPHRVTHGLTSAWGK